MDRIRKPSYLTGGRVPLTLPIALALVVAHPCRGQDRTDRDPVIRPGGGTIVFRDVTAAAGLADPLAGLMGHGAAWGDYDGDGRLDLYVGGFADRPDAEYAPAEGPVSNRLFRNGGDGRFRPAGQPAVEFHARTSGAVFADLDNDGDPELYVANNARPRARRDDEPQRSAQVLRSRLFRNDGGTFVDISDAGGACPPALLSARNVGMLDFDGDGRLDLLLLEDRFTPGPRSVLLRNAGGLRFEEADRAAGLPDDLFGLGLAVADINGDGRPDLFVAHSNRLFLSRGDGTYHEPAAPRDLFAREPLDGEDWPCGAAFGDLDRDGRLDLVLTIHGVRARNRVYRNEGQDDGVPRFRDVTDAVGLGTIVPAKCPHVEVQDFDNDGWPDIYTTAAWRDADGTVTPLIYRNQGVRGGLPRFAPPRPIRAPMAYYPAGPSADFDGDGRLDLLLVNWFGGDRCHLLRNEGPRRHWLVVRVAGRRINRTGIGDRVRLYLPGQIGEPAGLIGYREVAVGYGYASGQPAVCHFGLGDATRVDVHVTLPGGTAIARPGIEADRILVVEEP